MGFNLGAGLQALANAGTGYVQGQQQASQNDYTRQMQALWLQNAHQVADQNSQKAQWQQQEMDDMMKGSIAKPTPIINPQTGQPLNAPPPQPQPTAAQQQEQNDPGTFFSNLAASARSHGDLVGASEAYANLANLQSTQQKQQEEQSAMQTAELKRQQMHYTNSGMAAQQLVAVYGDTPQALNAWKMQVMGDPNSSPEERQNVHNTQWSPGIMGRIEQTGMTAAQQATAKIQQAHLALQQSHDRATEQQAAINSANTKAYHAADLALRKNNMKVGAIDKAPSTEQLRDAMPIVAQLTGADPNDPNNSVLYSKDVTSKTGVGLSSPTMIQIVSDANQRMRSDPSRSLTFKEAVTQATLNSIKHNEIAKATPEIDSGHWYEGNTPAKPAEAFNGITKPIPLSGELHKDPSLRIPGKIYEMINNKTKAKVALKWTKEGWVQP